MGFIRLAEVSGKHHRMFCQDGFIHRRQSTFWNPWHPRTVPFRPDSKRRHANGESIWLEATTTLLGRNGKVQSRYQSCFPTLLNRVNHALRAWRSSCHGNSRTGASQYHPGPGQHGLRSGGPLRTDQPAGLMKSNLPSARCCNSSQTGKYAKSSLPIRSICRATQSASASTLHEGRACGVSPGAVLL